MAITNSPFPRSWLMRVVSEAVLCSTIDVEEPTFCRQVCDLLIHHVR